jgi:hypothetical protein
MGDIHTLNPTVRDNLVLMLETVGDRMAIDFGSRANPTAQREEKREEEGQES